MKVIFLDVDGVLNSEKDLLEAKGKPDIDIIVGRYIIDAKSIMGIFSVDLSRELVLKISSDDVEECKEIREKLKAFIVED